MNYADDIKQSVSMKDICYQYGISVDNHGYALCPFHADKRRPSMKIYDGNRGYCCFSCGESGDTINFVMKFFGIKFNEALAKINDDFRLGLPIGQQLSGEQQRTADREARKRRAELDRVKREGERLSKAYHVALDRYIALDRVLTANKPQSENDITEEYAQALRQMPIAKYNLEVAEIALYNFEHRNDNS
ncbi:MAG: hypothetical protein KBT46_05145 [Ruminococcus sp.]|nr:hypothetical protein [Candidatus Copronaster equi]